MNDSVWFDVRIEWAGVIELRSRLGARPSRDNPSPKGFGTLFEALSFLIFGRVDDGPPELTQCPRESVAWFERHLWNAGMAGELNATARRVLSDDPPQIGRKRKRLGPDDWGSCYRPRNYVNMLRAGDPIFEDAAQPSAHVMERATKPASPVKIEEWYRGYVQSGAQVAERVELPAAAKHFGRVISRESFREMKRRVLKELRPDLQNEEQPARLRIGRRASNCAGK